MKGGGITSITGKMAFNRLRHGTKSLGLERNKIEEGMVTFSFYRCGQKRREAFHLEREFSESKSRVLNIEDFY
jgi:hypothetical protein